MARKSAWKTYEVTLKSQSVVAYRVKARSRDEVMNMDPDVIQERGDLRYERYDPVEFDWNDISEVMKP